MDACRKQKQRQKGQQAHTAQVFYFQMCLPTFQKPRISYRVSRREPEELILCFKWAGRPGPYSPHPTTDLGKPIWAQKQERKGRPGSKLGTHPHRGLTLSHLRLRHPLTDHAAGVVHHGGGLELHRLHHIANADLQREGNHGGSWAVPTPASPIRGERWVSSDCWPLRSTASFLLLLPHSSISAPQKPAPSFYW